jgi:hypothetical protein
LVSILAGQAVGREDAKGLDLTVAHGVAQRVQAGPIEAGAAIALVPEHVAVAQLVTAGLGPDADATGRKPGRVTPACRARDSRAGQLNDAPATSSLPHVVGSTMLLSLS